ncbi:protein VAC14 homolog isoform X2 [Chrysoperla carnea]|uniref:protein VAC14 homolog isoform X2 n=1 Tax=Chrysoperla carnea TaxID=189513 RepID=UPI001D0989E4|nr:protein VAC14 homolog isoform X2 [Chrysoperla carnea]
MTDKDYAPLSAACVRALHDKVHDKRKTAALEVEKMVRDFYQVNNASQIKRIIKVCGEFATSQNPFVRRGGLLALASVAIALGKDASVYTHQLIKPIISCFADPDTRLRFAACESLYNVVKAVRDAILPYFSEVFNALSKLATDPDQSVKSASEVLDRLLKDIVTESPAFDLVGFMPLLRERIYTKNPCARQFIISWISVLDAVPDIDLIIFLPEILDGLFRLLEDSPGDVKKTCDSVLGEFLRKIKNDPTRIAFPEMINILITTHAQSTDELVQFTAITWIQVFVQLSGPLMRPYMSGIFTAILPCLAYDGDSRKNIKETATAVSLSLMRLVTLTEDNSNLPPLEALNLSDEERKAKTNLDLPSIVLVLKQHLAHNSVQTKVAVLEWIYHLYTNIPNEMFNHIDELFVELLRTLSDSSNEVVKKCLVVISEIISPHASTDNFNQQVQQPISGENILIKNDYYKKFIVDLLRLFRTDKTLLESRGTFIIRQLCVNLNAEDIYRSLAQILFNESNLKFVSTMVETLNVILFTAQELFELRMLLKELNTEESCKLFQTLYQTWCHNPVATVALCLLSQNYQHASQLIRSFGNLEVTVEFLTEIDMLVQLIESPIFAFLRLELLEVPCNPYLVRSLYGLLMLLPQSDAFHTLRQRLACIPSHHLYCDNRIGNEVNNTVNTKLSKMDYKQMLEHFLQIQDKHKTSKQAIRAKNLNSLEYDMNPYEF